MITQNPVTGRSKRKLSGVYARTLWGLNIIQSCPKPSTVPPSPALKASRAAFGFVASMANQLQQGLLNQLYYAAPQGKSRRALLSSQLMKAIVRDGGSVSYHPERVTQLGTNITALTEPYIVTPAALTIEINLSDLALTQSALTTNIPLTIALSYGLHVIYNLQPLTTLTEGILTIGPIPSNWLGQELYLYPLFEVNMGTTNNPIYTAGRFEANPNL